MRQGGWIGRELRFTLGSLDPGWGRAAGRAASETGTALIEVLVTSVVVGIAAAGIALMFSFGNTWVVAKGDDRVAQVLAQQKIEQLRSLGFSCIHLGGPAAYNAPLTGCTATQNYNEGGATWVAADGTTAATPAGGAPIGRNFTRLTCVEYVSETNFSSPAYAGGTTGAPCNANPPAAPTGQTTPIIKRITVIVQPAQYAADVSGNRRYADPPVVLQAWIGLLVPGGL